MIRQSPRPSRLAAILALSAACVLSMAATAEARMVQGTVVAMDSSTILLRMSDGTQQQFLLASGYPIPGGVHAGMAVELTLDETTPSTTVSAIHAVPAASASEGPSTQAAPATSAAPAGQSQAGMPDAQADQSELPQTASPVPLITFVGLAALLAAGGMTWRRRRAGLR